MKNTFVYVIINKSASGKNDQYSWVHCESNAINSDFFSLFSDWNKKNNYVIKK